jgi:uncharacterized protein YndB with AHSA1/START domain
MNTTLRMIDGRPVLRIERDLAQPPEKVWKAITDPAELAHWFPAHMRTELHVGAPIEFTFDSDSGAVTSGKIVELDRPKLFVFEWGESVLRWELVPSDSGCLLVFTHTLGGAEPWGDWLSGARHAAGWDLCLDRLAGRLDDRPPARTMDEWFPLAERYVEEFGLGEGELHDHADGYLVRFERDLIHPVEEVWGLLADGEDVGEGSPVPVAFTHGYNTAGPVTAVEPPHVLEYAWHHDDTPAGRVRFEIRKQEPIGSRLVVTQTVSARLADHRATALAAWHTHLELLFAALHGDIRCPWPAERTEQLRKTYAEHLEG